MLDHFHIIYIYTYYSDHVCSVKPEGRPRIVIPVVAIAIEKPLQLADSLANHPFRIEFKVNQVSFICELATAMNVYWQLMLTVQCVTWDMDAVSHTCIHIHPALCVYMRNLCWRRLMSLNYVHVCVSLGQSNGVNTSTYCNIGVCILYGKFCF